MTDSAAVNAAVNAAKSLPDLAAKLEAVDPNLAQQLTGKALIASKTPWGVMATMGVAYVAGKYGLGWSEGWCELVAGAGVLVGSYAMRWITSHPISGIMTKGNATVKALPILLLLSLPLVACGGQPLVLPDRITTTTATTTPVLNPDGSVKTPGSTTSTTTEITEIERIVDGLSTYEISDLKHAQQDADAQTPPDELASACWAGLQPIALDIQKMVADAFPAKVTTTTTVDGAAPAPAPTPLANGIFYTFQRGRDKLQDIAAANGRLASFLANQKGQLASLRVRIQKACGGLYMDVGQDALNPLGKLLNGVGSSSGLGAIKR